MYSSPFAHIRQSTPERFDLRNLKPGQTVRVDARVYDDDTDTSGSTRPLIAACTEHTYVVIADGTDDLHDPRAMYMAFLSVMGQPAETFGAMLYGAQLRVRGEWKTLHNEIRQRIVVQKITVFG